KSGISALKPKYGTAASPQTIDALFAPLPSVETRGRAWLFMNHELKPVNLRLGSSDVKKQERVVRGLDPEVDEVGGCTRHGSAPASTASDRRARSRDRAARATR